METSVSFKKKSSKTTGFEVFVTHSSSKIDEQNQNLENTTRIKQFKPSLNGNKRNEIGHTTIDKTEPGRLEQDSNSYSHQSRKSTGKEQIKTGNYRDQFYEIETSKRKYDVENPTESTSSSHEYFVSSNISALGHESNNYCVVESNASSTLKLVDDNTLLTQESDKGFITKTAEAIKKGVKRTVYDNFCNFGKYFTSNRNGAVQDTPEADMTTNLDECEMHEEETLKKAVICFNLGSYLEELEKSIEDVRRNIKKKEDHDEFFEGIDKKIQKLSFKHHPDRVKNRGGTEAEIAKAQQLQTALNATRSALRVLNKAFLIDLGTYHKFSLYENLPVTSLCNEKELKCRIYEVNFKIGWISGIKRRKIIPEILKFLVESKKCVDSYLVGKVHDFIKLRDLSFFHLKRSIEGYQKLCEELETVENENKSEKDKSLSAFIQQMIKESGRDLRSLKMLEEMAMKSLHGKYNFFSIEDNFDPYFVFPFVWFTNIMLMCTVMIKGVSFWDKFKPKNKHNSTVNEELFDLIELHCLVVNYTSDDRNEDSFMQQERNFSIQNDNQMQNAKEEIKSKFCTTLQKIMSEIDTKFNIDHYKEIMTQQNFKVDYTECEILLSEFQEKKNELAKRFDKFEAKSTELDEEFDRLMKDFSKMEQKVKVNIENTKVLKEHFGH